MKTLLATGLALSALIVLPTAPAAPPSAAYVHSPGVGTQPAAKGHYVYSPGVGTQPAVKLETAAIAEPSPVDRIIGQERGRHGDVAVFGPRSSTLKSSIVVRPPDVADAAAATAGTVATSQGDGFDWADWGIGIGSGLGFALLLGAGLAASRQVRQRPRTA